MGEGLMIEPDASLLSTPIQTIAEIPRRYAVSTPDAIALSFEGRETSYRALDELSNQVANGLVAMGVRSASRIAILDKNSDIFFQILLGAAKTRAVLVPINARLAPPEIAFAINDAQTEVLFVGEAFVEIISAIRDRLDTVRQIIVLNSLYFKWRDAQPLLDPGLPVSPDDVCVQLYLRERKKRVRRDRQPTLNNRLDVGVGLDASSWGTAGVGAKRPVGSTDATLFSR
jgi:acyl-CoA synthetase (AMP-forming)/AMP-acid ligase II